METIPNQEENDKFKDEINKICHDISYIIQKKKLKLDADILLYTITIAQINLHIWHNKDEMQKNLHNEKDYLQLLKFAHQLNGIRNSIKNKILQLEGEDTISNIRSNFETDNLNVDLGLDKIK
jgi:hypothetical protein